MQHFDRMEDHPKLPLFALRVWRVKPGESWHVRILSQTYGGIMTHYAKGKSWYCCGKECPHAFHRAGSNWKGYCAVEVYQQDTRKWKPECLEITENLELDFRGRLKRGQVWVLSCPNDERKKNPPVGGDLLEQLDQDTIPQPFDIVPPIRSCYHCTITDFSVKNPMPDRVLLSVSEGLPPKDVREAEEKAAEVERQIEADRKSKAQEARKQAPAGKTAELEDRRKKILENIGRSGATSDNLNGTQKPA